MGIRFDGNMDTYRALSSKEDEALFSVFTSTGLAWPVALPQPTLSRETIELEASMRLAQALGGPQQDPLWYMRTNLETYGIFFTKFRRSVWKSFYGIRILDPDVLFSTDIMPVRDGPVELPVRLRAETLELLASYMLERALSGAAPENMTAWPTDVPDWVNEQASWSRFLRQIGRIAASAAFDRAQVQFFHEIRQERL